MWYYSVIKICALTGLNIPSDEIEKYAYVLKPLSDLYPTLAHPFSGVKFEQMWLDFDNTQKLGWRIFALVVRFGQMNSYRSPFYPV